MPDPFPAAVRRLAAARGLTLSEVARRSGVPRTYLQALLAGKSGPTLATARRVARALGASLAEFDAAE